ncbi:MAG TPA: YdeI/OmpD-associated family protein [Planctomycetota bacterium]|nr:YdeI/OmpD-associated family protein [Planctomycetota bacterium]
MGTRDPRVDAYIRKVAPFARPILTRLRDDVHESCPEVVETLKWNSPSFEYEGILCGFAAFKQHCAFGFWKHALVVGDDPKAKEAMGSFGRITSVADLPSRSLLKRYIRKAMRLNEQGIKAPREKTRPRDPIAMHPDLRKALAGNRKAAATLKAFPPSQQRDYLEWIAEAKRDETRARRVAQAVAWLADGKPRNWKYMR